jgi:hypothetical protein
MFLYVPVVIVASVVLVFCVLFRFLKYIADDLADSRLFRGRPRPVTALKITEANLQIEANTTAYTPITFY